MGRQDTSMKEFTIGANLYVIQNQRFNSDKQKIMLDSKVTSLGYGSQLAREVSGEGGWDGGLKKKHPGGEWLTQTQGQKCQDRDMKKVLDYEQSL